MKKWHVIERLAPRTWAQVNIIKANVAARNAQAGYRRYEAWETRRGEDDYLVEIWEFS